MYERRKPRLRWRKEPNEKGQARICQRPRGYDLWLGDERIGGAYPHSEGFSRRIDGYYWTARGNGIPLRNTAGEPLPSKG